jgi:hypothetical protein
MKMLEISAIGMIPWRQTRRLYSTFADCQMKLSCPPSFRFTY